MLEVGVPSSVESPAMLEKREWLRYSLLFRSPLGGREAIWTDLQGES